MKKIFIALLILISLSSTSYAVSEDVYVRQDVFDAKMEALFARMDAKFEKLDAKIDTLRSDMNAKIDSAIGEIKGDIKALSVRVDGIETRMDERFNSLEKRMDFMNNFIYYLFVLLAALIILPPVSRWLEARKEAKNSLRLKM